MLQIYRDGHFKNVEFADKFQSVPNATTPEYLVPLALLPIEDEEKEARLNPIVVERPQGGQGGRGRGGAFERGEGGKGGRGKGERGAKGERGGKGEGRDGWGRNNESGDVRNSGEREWNERGRRGERHSNGDDDHGDGGGRERREPRSQERDGGVRPACSSRGRRRCRVRHDTP